MHFSPFAQTTAATHQHASKHDQEANAHAVHPYDELTEAAAAQPLSRSPRDAAARPLRVGRHERSANGSDSSTSQPTQKTKHTVASQMLEEEIVRWIEKCERLRLPVVTGEAIRTKAAQVRDRILRESLHVANHGRLAAMVFLNGWLDKLKHRHEIKSRALHGEASSASDTVVAAGREALRKVTRGYSKRDIFNMDETVYFYCIAPGRTYSKTSFVGLKQMKKPITVAVTSNADGFAKVLLLFVGTTRQPRCFLGKRADEIGIEYNNAAKGWMTTALFQRWLDNFNAAMRDEKCNALLLLDNASFHHASNELSNVRVHMLPPNTTSHLQPQDSGIIRAMKAQINAINNKHMVEKFDLLTEHTIGKANIESVAKALLDVDILVAIRWAQEAWDSVTSATISNCWRHTAILDEESYELVDSINLLLIAPQ